MGVLLMPEMWHRFSGSGKSMDTDFRKRRLIPPDPRFQCCGHEWVCECPKSSHHLSDGLPMPATLSMGGAGGPRSVTRHVEPSSYEIAQV